MKSWYGRHDTYAPLETKRAGKHEAPTIWTGGLKPPAGGDKKRMPTESIAFSAPEGSGYSLVLGLGITIHAIPGAADLGSTGNYYYADRRIIYDPTSYVLGDGSEAWMYTMPAITLGHELIHAWWNLIDKQDNGSESMMRYWQDVVIDGPPIGTAPFTENMLRKEWQDRMPYSNPNAKDSNGNPIPSLPVQRPKGT